MFERDADQLGSGADLGLGEELLQRILHGTLGDVHACRYLFIRQALNQEPKHFRLTAGQ